MSEESLSAYERLKSSIEIDEAKNNVLKLSDKKTQSPKLGLKDWPTPDNDAVTSGCAFLSTLISDPKALDSKNILKRMTAFTILARLNGGADAVHDLLKNHEGYSKELIDMEIEDAIDMHGPAYCSTINKNCFNECIKCPYFGDRQIASPIKIKGEDHIASKDSGFWEIEYDAKGKPKQTRPAYYDLLKEFKLQYSDLTNIGDCTYVWNGKHWEIMEPQAFKAFAEIKMRPKPIENHRREFLNTVKAQHYQREDTFLESTHGLINMANGVFDIKSGQIIERSSKQGFKYVLPYDYNPDATAPTWERFLDDVTMGRFGMQQVIMEYIGYCLAGGDCLAEKALILYGDGENGKSTLMDTIIELAGEKNTSSLSLTALNDPAKRYMAENKLVNIGEETNVRALGDSEVFKTMVTGGKIDIKKLYSQPYTVRNRTKLIVAANELPKSKDRSHGLYRRMILVPFDAVFSHDKGNKDPEMRSKLKTELPGIFNMAIENFKRLQTNNYKFSEPDELKIALEAYKTENDNVLRFFLEHLEKTDDPESYLYKQDLYKEYKEKCEAESDFSVNANTFFRALKKQFPKSEDKRRYKGSDRVWAFSHIKKKD